MSEHDILIEREDGIAKVTSATDEGRKFLDEQYGGDVKMAEDSCLSFFLDYIRKIGLTSRLMML